MCLGSCLVVMLLCAWVAAWWAASSGKVLQVAGPHLPAYMVAFTAGSNSFFALPPLIKLSTDCSALQRHLEMYISLAFFNLLQLSWLWLFDAGRKRGCRL